GNTLHHALVYRGVGTPLLGHLGANGSRMHGVRADAVLRVLEGSQLGEEPNRALGRLILRTAVGHPYEAELRRDVDDGAPPPCRMAGMTALLPRNTPLAFTSITRSHASTGVSSSRLAPPMPALLMRTFSVPKCFRAGSPARCQPASLVTSSRVKTASPPLARTSASTARPSASRTSPIITRAPSRATRRASAAPLPSDPPLMSATLPSSLISPPPHRCLSRAS